MGLGVLTTALLIGCALFKTWFLISEGELKEQIRYSTERLSAQMISTENQKIAKGVQDTWKGKLGRIRQMSEADSG